MTDTNLPSVVVKAKLSPGNLYIDASFAVLALVYDYIV